MLHSTDHRQVSSLYRINCRLEIEFHCMGKCLSKCLLESISSHGNIVSVRGFVRTLSLPTLAVSKITFTDFLNLIHWWNHNVRNIKRQSCKFKTTKLICFSSFTKLNEIFIKPNFDQYSYNAVLLPNTSDTIRAKLSVHKYL